MPAAPAAAAAPAPVSFSDAAASKYSVTFVARVCPSYADVMANRARNDLQESLKDLGKDSVYLDGQPIDPAVETPNHPSTCAPLTGARFTFGAGIEKTGQYSNVTVGSPGIDGTTAPTTASVPLLDASGLPVSGASIAGAVTAVLTPQQAQRAAYNNALWVQGGTQAVPLPVRQGGGSYGFAAFRCALDNLNGDNVEWVGFPAGNPSARHVFCYAYYVDLPPAQGTIVIRKALTAGSTVSQEFAFASNATYNPSGTFGVQINDGQPGSATFVRAVSSAFGGQYTFTEDTSVLGPEGWALTSVACTGPGYAIDPVTHTVSIDLGTDATVVCTWVNDPPHDPGLTVRKVSEGGVGTFPMSAQRLTDPAGIAVSDAAIPLKATTTVENVPVTASGLPPTVSAGQWQISEQLPESTTGTWSVVQAYCNGRAFAAASPTLLVVLPVNGGADCTFVNQFTPNGVLVLKLLTHNGTGTGSFVVSTPHARASDPLGPQVFSAVDPHRLNLTATTTAPGTSAIAVGDPTHNLALRTYGVISTPPLPVAGNVWQFVSFTCANAVTSATSAGAVTVSLTAQAPTASCTAIYQLDPVSTLDVTKVITGDTAAQTGPAIVDVACADNSTGQVVAPPNTPGPFTLPTPLSFLAATNCVVTEPITGAAPGATVTTTAVVETGGDPSTDTTVALPATIAIPASDAATVVTVTNSYTALHCYQTPAPHARRVPCGCSALAGCWQAS